MSRQISAKAYLLMLSLFGLLLFIVFALNLLFRGEQIQQAISQERQHEAKASLERAVALVADESKQILTDLSQWDEIHQQLGDPTYYVYWREIRLKQSQRFPAFVDGLELYGPDGKLLVSLPYQDFPSQVPERTISVVRGEERDFVMAFAPIATGQGEGATGLHGYLGVKLDFLAALQSLYRFAEIDPDSLHLGGEGREPLSLKQATSLLEYELVDEPGSNRLGDILLASLRDFFLLFVSMLLIFYFTVAILFVRPLSELKHFISRLRHGDRGYREVFYGLIPTVAEFVTVRDSLNEYQGELDQAQLKLDQQNVELWQLAHRDSLTGAKNRLAFDEDWKELIELAHGKRLDISLMLLDCDFFKAINDTYGHEIGDRVIQSIAESLEEVLREGESLYRLGGDEFVTILVNAGRDEAHQVALRCAESVQRHAFKQLGIKETVKLSVGLAHASGLDIANLSELPRQADVAMYHAKSSTREKIVHYVPTLEQESSALVSNRIVSAVLEAVDGSGAICMHYQPLVDAERHQPSHYEALVRIEEEGGIIGPGDIFPVVARRRLDVELDKAVLNAVERDLARQLLPAGVGVSINVSGAFLALNDFCEHFSGLSHYLKRHPIIIEITETSFISHLQHASECLRKMRQSGFLVALDDFGSGYSSIRYLANMPVDIVKFDISMVHDLNKDQRTRLIIEKTASLIVDAGYKLVAEGIEDAEILRRANALQPALLQGYLFGHPQPLEGLFG